MKTTYTEHAQAAYGVAKLTSPPIAAIRETLIVAGADPQTADLCLRNVYELAYLDGVGRGLTSAIETAK